jgi:tRNA(Ile)-lysidine synthetase-like protein
MLVAAVRALINEHRMIEPGAPLVVAVSGGPDSLCLLHLLAALQSELAAPLHVAHLDHMIRGAESSAEAAFVGDVARRWGLAATVEAVDVPALAQARRANLHALAREVRYAFLARVARSIGAQAVAVAHHAGDQAETVLMHLLRGSGADGLAGMRPVVPWEEWAPDQETRRAGDKEQEAISLSPALLVSPALVRPLLHVTREDIESYCREHALEPRRDPTNMDLSATRNRIRHDLLPRLIEYNPQIVRALGRTAAVCADEQAFVRDQLDAAWPGLARMRPGAVDFDGAAWQALHPALQRAALRRAHAMLARGATLGLEHVEQARALIGRGVGRCIELPGGVVVTAGYGGAFIVGAAPEPDAPQLTAGASALPVPGRVDLGGGWAIEAGPHPAPAPAPESAWEIYLDADTIAEQLLVRRRRPGDRLRPLGGRGSRRLQDLFVDAKLPRALRDGWPLVATPAAIVWVAGLRAAAPFAATPGSRAIIKIQLTRNT